ncbi:MAG: hypothetical protein EOR73_24680, partial [Mesorhizobium sp.]
HKLKSTGILNPLNRDTLYPVPFKRCCGARIFQDAGGTAPPLSCRTSPPRGGRLALIAAFANLQH